MCGPQTTPESESSGGGGREGERDRRERERLFFEGVVCGPQGLLSERGGRERERKENTHTPPSGQEREKGKWRGGAREEGILHVANKLREER